MPEEKIDSQKHDEMIDHFKNLVTQNDVGTKHVKFMMSELVDKLQDHIANGQTEFTMSFAAYANADHAQDYANKKEIDPKDVVNKATLLLKDPATGNFHEIGHICPPPENCD